MKKFIFGILFVALAAYGVTEFGDLTMTGSVTSVGNLTTQGFLSANTGIASLNGGTLRLHESNTNGGSKITVQTVANLASDYVLTLPPDDGSSGQVLQTDGNGVLTWVSGAGDVTQTGTQTLTNKTLTSPVIGTTATFTNNASAQFFEATGNGTDKITVAAPASLAGDVTFTLPPTNGTSGHVLQTNGSGVTSWVAAPGAGAVTASSTDTFTNKTFNADGTGNIITNIENADIKAGAAIALNKLAAVTASRVLVSDGSGFISPTSTTSSEIALLNGQSGTLLTVANSRYATVASQGTATLAHATTTEVVLCGPSGSDITYTLPSAASGFSGSTYGSRVYTFIKTTSGNNCIIDANASETINGATTYTMTAQYCSVSMITNATSWFNLFATGCP